MRKIGSIDVPGLVLGTNTFGWTSSEAESHDVLDLYVANGGKLLDTADQYSSWVAGNEGGESETIIGSWLAKRGNRSKLQIATKCGLLPGYEGLSPKNIRVSVENSLRRLQTDYIDILFAHKDDPTVPLEKTLATFTELIDEGKVRYIGASNYVASRLEEALKISEEENFAPFVVLEALFSLVERQAYEQDLREVVNKYALSTVSYYSLASGFLTGKYTETSTPSSPRTKNTEKYQTVEGYRLISILQNIADRHEAQPAAVALAWIDSHHEIAGPIASARTVEQLRDLMNYDQLVLTDEDITMLNNASENF